MYQEGSDRTGTKLPEKRNAGRKGARGCHAIFGVTCLHSNTSGLALSEFIVKYKSLLSDAHEIIH